MKIIFYLFVKNYRHCFLLKLTELRTIQKVLLVVFSYYFRNKLFIFHLLFYFKKKKQLFKRIKQLFIFFFDKEKNRLNYNLRKYVSKDRIRTRSILRILYFDKKLEKEDFGCK